MHLASSCSLKQCPCRIGCAAHVAATSCCAFDRMRADGDAAQECRGYSYCRSLAATLNCLAAIGSTEPVWPHAGLIPNYKNQLASEADQLSDVSQTGSPWSFARILSADCSKMLRIRPLTAAFPSLKIKNSVPFSGNYSESPFKTMSALDNAIEILRCFAPHQPEISNADVIRLTGKPKSSTSRLLRQLRECGLLEQDALTRRYRPGLLVFELGRLHRTQNDFVALAEQRLRAVCAKTGHTGYIVGARRRRTGRAARRPRIQSASGGDAAGRTGAGLRDIQRPSHACAPERRRYSRPHAKTVACHLALCAAEF